MKKYFILLLLTWSAVAFSQHFTPSFIRKSESYIIYYNFYNGVQMIEVDQVSHEIHGIRSLDNPLPVYSTIYSRIHRNQYIFRNELGQIVKQFNVGANPHHDTDFIAPQKFTGKLWSHKERAPLEKIEWEKRASERRIAPYFPIARMVKDFTYPVSEGTKSEIGLIDTLGNYLLEPVYQEILYIDSAYFIKFQEKYGLIDAAFKPLLEPSYDRLMYFNRNEAYACKGKCGVIDHRGKTIVDLKYDEILPLSSDTIVSRRAYKFVVDDKIGVMDHHYNIIIPPRYVVFEWFEKGYYVADTTYKMGVLDSHFKMIIPLKYDEVTEFDNQYKVKLRSKDEVSLLEGMCDSTGREIIPVKYQYVDHFDHGKAKVCQERKWGLIDKKGNVLIPIEYEKYENIEMLQNGMVRLRQEDKWSVLNSKAQRINDHLYDEVDDLYMNGYVKVRKGDRWGVLDESGKEIIPCRYQAIGNANEGMLSVLINNKALLLNLKNEALTSFPYDNIGVFENGFALAYLKNKIGYINKSGRQITALIYDEAYNFKSGLALVKRDGKWGLVNKHGKEVIPVKYEAAFHNWYKLIPVKLNGKWGCMNRSGKLVVPLIYDHAEYTDDGKIKMELNDKPFYFDEIHGKLTVFPSISIIRRM